MIDRSARDRIAELLRHLASGRISLQHFEWEAEDIAMVTNDRAVHCASAVMLHDKDTLWWSLQAFRGSRRLPKERRRRYATTIAFLHSDVEYAWAPLKFDYTADFGMMLATVTMLFVTNFLIIASLLNVLVFPLAIVAAYSVVHLYQKSQVLLKAAEEEWRSAADFSIFPFVSRDAFERVRQHPRLLTGARS